MKTKIELISTVIIVVLLSSCATTFYQVYKTTATNKMANKDNQLVYEDENCKVSYNLWGEGGNIGFRFFNKTDKNISLNLEESFFILNGISYNYYRSRVFTTSTTAGATTAKTSSASKRKTQVVSILKLSIAQLN